MFKLTAIKRDVFGKDLADSRAAGQMPVVVYGAGQAAESFSVSTKDFKKVLVGAGESTLVTLEGDAKGKDVLIHAVAYAPVSGEPIHADLYLVDKTKKISVHVPLVFEGVSPAVKELGGALIKVLHELEVEALPADLPHDLKVDISILTTLDSQIHASDIAMPKGVVLISEPEEVVASITEAGEEVKEEDATVDLSTIEVEEKGKKEDDTETAA
jgi:large subunit ribosomal protein L25